MKFHSFYVAAAKKYIEVCQHRTAMLALYERAKAAGDISDVDFKKAAKNIEASTRSDFRGISSKLTKQVPFRFVAVGADVAQKIEIEHPIVLCKVHDYIIDNEMSLDELVRFIEENIFGVLVTPEQHRALPKQSMPSGWKFGDDPLARYHHAKIEVRAL